MKQFIKKWGHALLGLYAFIYMPCFMYLESHVVDNYHLIHCPLDNLIPFCEFFIIPYFFWFLFMAVAIIYFFFRSQGECIRMACYLILGMSTAILIYFVYPNGLGNLRPTVFPRENFCTDLVKFLYSSDTSTNVLPSLHVYNTLVIVVAVYKSSTFGKYHNMVKIIISITGFFICISTLFLKQHSVYDVIAAIILIILYYPIFYKTPFFKRFK